MKSRHLPKLTRGVLLAGLAFCWFFRPPGAAAALTYDLRVNGGKVVFVTQVGQVITLDLYAQVTGASGNALPEGFQDGFGSVLSSAGGNIMGSLSSSFVAPFNATSAQPGTQQNLDTDSDLDLGSNATAHSTDFFFARSDGMTTGGTPITDGSEFKIASFNFTVQSVGSFADFTPISINFRVPLFANGLDIEAVWQQDGQVMDSNGVDGEVQPTVGAAVMVGVPEPCALGLLLVGVAGFAARRRRHPRA